MRVTTSRTFKHRAASRFSYRRLDCRSGAVLLMYLKCIVSTIAVLSWITALAASQLTNAVIDPAHPAIGYNGPTSDPVAALNRKIQAGESSLAFEERTGYLRSLLAALDIPVESQIALFSGTSLQSRLIHARNPRTIFFNDGTAVGWMPGGF